MLQSIALFFVTLVGFQSFAQNLPDFVGTYNFNANGLQLVQLQHRLVVVRQTPDSIAYINQLQADGYTCQPKASLQYQCIRFDKQLTENSNIRNILIEKFQGSKIDFANPQSAYQQTLNSSSLQEYLRLQNSQFLNKNYNRLTLFVLPSVTKIELSSSTSTDIEYLVYRDVNSLNRMQRIVQTVRSQLNYVINEDRLYFYELAFIRN